MNKKLLTTQILLALAAAAMLPAGQAGAEMTYAIDGDSIEITTNETVHAPSQDNPDADKIYEDEKGDKHRLDEFSDITIHFNPVEGGDLRALGVYSARYGMEDNNVTVYVGSEDNPAEIANNDGLHLSNHFPEFYVRSYTAYIYAPNSDALNLSHDITSTTEFTGDGSMVYIGNHKETMGADGNGNLTAVVQNGNGIRANASIKADIENGITVGGKTDITLLGDKVGATMEWNSDELNELFGNQVFGGLQVGDILDKMVVSSNYNPSAIYAGNDMYSFNMAPLLESYLAQDDFADIINGANLNDLANQLINALDGKQGAESLGYGAIILQGATDITLKGDNNYGIFAGKNGSIQVKGDLTIRSSGNNSYGVAVGNSNLIYGNDLNVKLFLSEQGKQTIRDIVSEKVGDGFFGQLMGATLIAVLENSNGHNFNGVIDDSKNIHGTSVVLGDNIDVNIDLGEETESHAFYAEGIDDTEAHNQNSIVGNLNHLYVVGDVEAENGGLIDLHIGAEQNYLNGDIKAYGMAVASEDGESAQSTKSEFAKNATVNLAVDNALAGQGTIAAANGGIVNLTLGANSNWTGRADDYQDADDPEWAEAHRENLTNAFGDREISNSGKVNLTLGNYATWNVTGQSWVTELNGNNSYISLGDDKTGSNALHIGKLTGTNTFVMNVRPTETGDMLYVKDGTGAGTQNLIINNRDEVLENMDVGDAVRFATVQSAGGGFMDGEIQDNDSASSGTFGNHTRINDAGIFNVDFDIEYHDYGETVAGDLGTDEVYNGSSFGENSKPGDSYVDENYGPAGDGTDGQALRTEEEKPSGSQNVYIVRRENSMDNLSGAGETILSMSKVNYSNAVYMDRLNKRMGEARYIDGDDGLWVRLRHDRIGKDDAFRSQNTMFELGYDWHAKGQQDGEHRQGVAFDYMRGTADYQNVAGDGVVRRAGVWLYDTWLGDKGHYSDYVVKYGRLSNDFDIYGERGNKISGDYDNDVWSVSAEYGRKKDIGNEWYFEPQVQAQYAYVTSADYTTSQGTKVELDGIDSLIGRAGFRLGRDTSEGNTVYFKADILHEFLGDQSIRATDTTGTLDTTYENEGTWYDVGFGFSHKMGEDSYLFLDVEHSFGNDNDDTYQVNIGLNRAF